MVIPVVEADRVRLRPFRAEDRAVVFALFSDPQVVRYWSFPAWTDLDQADEFMRPMLEPSDNDSMIPWVIADRGSDRMVGTTTIFALHKSQPRAEIGYTLLREHWGQGLAREAVTRALVYGFEDLKLRRFEADIDPRNTASIALVERLGFQREGYMRERWLIAGEICDSAMFGLLAHELRR